MSDVWIPDNPSERQYTCPGCGRAVRAKRITDSCSYVIEHLDEKKGKGDEGDGKCKWKGSIPIALLGYKPPKEKKDEPQQTTASSGQSQPSTGGDVPTKS